MEHTSPADFIPVLESFAREREEIIASLKVWFAGQQDVTLAILYGSFSKGCQTNQSDVDIAVHTEPPAEMDRLLDIQTEISRITGRDIDIVDLRQADGIILTRILTGGVRVKDKPELYAFYNIKAIYFNEDYLPLLRRMQKAHIERFIHGS